jgi:hypothetical protein|tara:strand:- start:4598 stop:4816 length:219 start_codon:yes stop_codon:yes gene_type:complete
MTDKHVKILLHYAITAALPAESMRIHAAAAHIDRSNQWGFFFGRRVASIKSPGHGSAGAIRVTHWVERPSWA